MLIDKDVSEQKGFNGIVNIVKNEHIIDKIFHINNTQ